MMREETPTIEQARHAYCDGLSGTSRTRAESIAEFDRMIAEVRREAAEKAWREGELAGTRNQRDFHLYQQGKITETEYERRVNERANPYRAEAYRQEREEQ